MRILRAIAAAVLVAAFLLSLCAGLVCRSSYDEQHRDAFNAPPSRQYPLGTDELGRDRFARLLHGTRISLLLAPAAALLSMVLAGLAGGIAGYRGGWPDRVITRVIDLFVSLPWFFLFLTVRALLPLNVPPLGSLLATFAILGCVGWAPAARVVRAGARTLRNSDFLLLARANGIGRARLMARHFLPNLKPVLIAQFWLAVPAFILSEAGLGLLGLGVSEPLPSWGNLLRELESNSAVFDSPWLLAPIGALLLVVSCLQLVFRMEDVRS